MSNESGISQCPEAVETASLHFKASSKLQIFHSNGDSFQGNLSLLAVSQYYGLTFVGTVNGFIVLKTKEIFVASSPSEYRGKEVLLSSRPSYLTVDHSQQHLAVGCQTKIGPIVFIYNISTLVTKDISPMKTIPLSKPLQSSVICLCELMWQPNTDSSLTACFSDGSVVSMSLFQDKGNEIFSLPNSTQARCLCWSPKGKQIVIGCSDGSLSQFKPDLKFVKKLNPPPLFNGKITVVNVLWISSFQFAAAYKDSGKPEEFPVIVIVNSPKNEPINFVNYDDITYSCAFHRTHQLYLYHQSLWNLIYVASSNSMDIAVLHARDNMFWEQWNLGDSSRAELPLNDEKIDTYPVGLAVDSTSDQGVPWGEECLPPMPRLLLLSNEGLLMTFNIVNISPNVPGLCSPPKEEISDSYFKLRELNSASICPVEPNETEEVSGLLEKQEVKPTPGFVLPTAFPLCSTPLSTPAKTQQQQVNLPVQHEAPVQQPSIQFGKSTFFASSNDAHNQSSNPLFPLTSTSTKDSIGAGNQNLSVKNSEFSGLFNIKSTIVEECSTKPLSTAIEDSVPRMQVKESNENSFSKRAEESLVTLLNADYVKPVHCAIANNTKTPDANQSKSTPELSTVDESVYLTALFEEIEHFNSEIKEAIARVSVLDVKIGTEEEKLRLRKSIEKLNEFRQDINDLTATQRNEIHSVKTDIIEAFAWLEDAKSRNRQRKSPMFIQLKKSEELDSISSGLMHDIAHLKYYIETQLKQLFLHLDKEWMKHQDNCRLNIKNLMAIPSMEDLYKTMHLQLKILMKHKSIVEDLSRTVAERNYRIISHVSHSKSCAVSDSAFEEKKTSELSKLADNLLQIRIDREERNDIYTADAFSAVVKNQMACVTERSKKFNCNKRNILREILGEREMMKSRSIRSNTENSSFIRNSLSSLIAKKENVEQPTAVSKNTVENIPQLRSRYDSPVKFQRDADSPVSDSAVPGKKIEGEDKPFSTGFNSHIAWKVGSTLESQAFPPKSFSLSETAATKENSKPVDLLTFSAPKSKDSSMAVKVDSAKNYQKISPFVFKAAPVVSSGVTRSPTAATVSHSFSAPAISTASTAFNKSNTSALVTSSINFNSKSFSQQVVEGNSFLNQPNAISFAPTFNTVASPKKTTSSSTVSPLTTVFSISNTIKTNVSETSSDSKVTNTHSVLSSSVPAFSFTWKPSEVRNSTTTCTTLSSTLNSSAIEAGPFSFTSSHNSEKSTKVSLPDTAATNLTVSSAKTFTSLSSVLVSANTPGSSLSTTIPTEASPVIKTVATAPSLTVEASVVKERLQNKISSFDTSECNQVRPSESVTSSATSDIRESNAGQLTSEGAKNVDIKQSPETTDKNNKMTATAAGDLGDIESVSESKPSLTPVNTVSEAASASSLPQPVSAPTVVTNPQASTGSTMLSTFTSTTAVPFNVTATTCSDIPAQTNFTVTSPTSILPSSLPCTQTNSACPLFKTLVVTTSGSIFSQAPAVTSTSSNIFSHVTPSTTSVSNLGQSKDSEVGKTTDLFGQVLGSGLSTGSVFGNSSSGNTGGIFGKSVFDKSTGGSLFENASTTGTTTVATTSIFGTNSSSIFSRQSASFGQIPTSSATSSIFGQSQVSGTGNNFFGQNICSSFGSPTTAASNQNPFASSVGFNSKPLFGQSIFGQSNSEQNPFGRSSTSIFGNSSATTSTSASLFQSSFGNTVSGPFSGGQTTTGQSGFGSSSAFQKPLGGFGGSPVFVSGLPTTATFGSASTFGGAPTFGVPASFGNPQKVFGSQGTFGQGQAQATNFETLASQSTDGFASLAQQSQSPAFGGTTINSSTTFGKESSFGGNSFSSWRSCDNGNNQISD